MVGYVHNFIKKAEYVKTLVLCGKHHECGRHFSKWNHSRVIWCCSIVQQCLTLCDRMDCSTPGFPVLHHLPDFAQIHIHWVSDTIQPSHPLLPFSPPALKLPSIRVFSTESALHIRWPKYWSFSFSISPSSPYLGLVSFSIDWFDPHAVQGTLKSLL